MIEGMMWQGGRPLDDEIPAAIAYAKDKYNKQAQRVDVADTAVKEETIIAGVKVRPSRLVLPGTLYVIWEGV